MSDIIVIANQKGGVGKSTIAMNLASTLSENTAPVFLVDADPQGTLSSWSLARSHQVEQKIKHKRLLTMQKPLSPSEIEETVPSLTKENDYVIIDCGPANDRAVRSSLAVANFAIIPVSPSPLDIWSVQTTVEMFSRGIEEYHLTLKVRLLVSRSIPGSTLGAELRDALKDCPFPFFKTTITQRVPLARAAVLGFTIHEYEPNSRAAHEFNQLGKEVRRWLRQP